MKTSFMRTGSARKNRLLEEHNHDPYKSRRKLREPSVCPVCKAVFRAGRWQWADHYPADSAEEMCQACRRIRDNCPAGVVTLKGGARYAGQDEMLNLVRNVEQAEKSEHPLHRVMRIERQADSLVVTTTDLHLARRLGEAVRAAYKGSLDWHYNEGACLAQVNWVPALERERNHNHRQMQRR